MHILYENCIYIILKSNIFYTASILYLCYAISLHSPPVTVLSKVSSISFWYIEMTLRLGTIKNFKRWVSNGFKIRTNVEQSLSETVNASLKISIKF